MDFYVSPVTLLFESSLVSIASISSFSSFAPSQKLEIRTKMSEKRILKLKKD